MKLDVTYFRYVTKEEFRVLTAVEIGMRNHELVPAPLIESIAKVSRGGCYKLLQSLLRHKLVAHDGKKYDGYRLTYHGYDFLAIRALVQRGSITSVGRRLGVGKESDVHYAQGPNGELLALKLHRLGRISFRAIKSKRDYLKGRQSASWQYMARLAAIKEYAYMKALKDEGFPVPNPIDQNRHCVVMNFIQATPLMNIRHLNKPHAALERLMRLLVRLARAGVVHGDFNEFNLMIDGEEKITLIDFPQLVHINHANAEEFFDRDVQGVRDFFRKRLGIDVERWPTWKDAMASADEAQAAEPTSASGTILRTGAIQGLRREDDAMLVTAHERSRATGEEGGARQEGHSDDDEEDDDDDDEDDAEGEEGDVAREDGQEAAAFQPLLGEGCETKDAEDEELERAALEGPQEGQLAETVLAAEGEGRGGENGADEQGEEGSEDESDGSEDSEQAPEQIPVAGKRVRKRQTAKDARKNLQRQQKTKPARANNQKCKETRRAKSEIKEYLG